MVGSYKLAHKVKLNGVIIIAVSVTIAVILTERAALPLASREKKLDIFPPGQAATMNIPSARLGCGSKNTISRKVRAGSKTKK